MINRNELNDPHDEAMFVENRPELAENGWAVIASKPAEALDAIPVDAEVEEPEDKAGRSAAWSPRYPLTAHRLFQMALGISAIDSARHALGFFYKSRLKHECELLVEQPIFRHNRSALWKSLYLRRSNPEYFICHAAGMILTIYLNDMEK